MFSVKGWLFIVVAVLSATMMNVAMKSLVEYSSYWVYVIAIGVGLVIALGGYFFLDRGSAGMVGFNRWMVVLGVSVALLNFAYIWIYQEGGNVALLPLIITALLTLVLTVVGVRYFGEHITVQQYVGMAVIVIGLGVMVA